MHDGDATWNDLRAEPAAADPEPAAGAAGVAGRLVPLLTKVMLGEQRESADDLPIRVRAWDGSAIGPAAAPAYVIRHRRALRRLLWKPGELGFVRAYVAGELDIEGDVFTALAAVQRVMASGDGPIRLSGDDKRDIVRTAVTLGAVGPEPKPPPEERGDADAAPVPEPAAFFARLFGDGLAHGTGHWAGAGTDGLDRAQSAAHAVLAERLGLFPGARVLDLNCGWGAFALHAALRHGARVVGLARTPEQAEHVRAAAAAAGAAVEARGWDLAMAGEGPYDAVVGLADAASVDRPASRLAGLLAPGGRLVLQETTGGSAASGGGRTITAGYLVPGGAPPRRLGALADELDDAGLELREVVSLREDHARTLRAWATGLQHHWAGCAELAGPGRARVWLLYLAASALACENGRTSRYQVHAIRRISDGLGGVLRSAGPIVTGP